MNWKYENERIYSIDEKGELMAEVTFTHNNNSEINIDHVYVNSILRGKGVAGEAMLVVVDYLRKEGLKATATCSYAGTWFKNHGDLYSDVISKDIANQVVACKINGKH
ncbi:GNAT family N-acetyltransferase [Clostridium weizhouense]|uniref:N-acetyltransferase n=1 Tax=Clostridium weizhouense TaxID=2859781 RepID=A0ABS7ASG4_9CLOT|nr:GNAT family N-acetyltransferase [Clostridium weizhouense]MBW6411617.1 N-acetyltransferase [Clostridium weizhouense]